jgi:soluble lytic murein transglycosylase-like protein
LFVNRAIATCALLLLLASASRAEYVVLRSGQRLTVTSYETLGDRYRLHLAGGHVDVAIQDVSAIEPDEIFTPLPPQASAKPPYKELVEAAADKYKVDADLITSVIAVESNFDPKAMSKKNARGLMQLLPETATMLGVKDAFDPSENIDAGTRYLSDLLKRYNNDLILALAAYNAGPEKVEQYRRVPPYRETISYVRKVRESYKNKKAQTAGSSLKNSKK